MSVAILIAGLGLGDEGKGAHVDLLTRKHDASLVCRYNGGAQAAHNVVLDDGTHHTFAQFGSGTLAGARTHLSRFMVVNPFSLFAEAEHLALVMSLSLEQVLARLTVEGEALVTTPFHMAANRIREYLRDKKRHGSCGMGVGETRVHALAHPEEALRAVDLDWRLPFTVIEKLQKIQARYSAEFKEALQGLDSQDGLGIEWGYLSNPETLRRCTDEFLLFSRRVRVVGSSYLEEELRKDETIIFEGAQGVLLDESFGFQPYTTWSNVTFANALKLLEGSPTVVRKVGILRGYATRHGAGPLVTEEPGWTLKSDHNKWGPWQESFRVGHFDLVQAHYALAVVKGVQEIAMSCLDHLKGPVRVCVAYENAPNEFFHVETGKAVRIRLNRPADYDWQERMTKALGKVKPVYETFPNVGAFVAFVEKSLGVPITVTAFGPRAKDRETRQCLS